MDYFYGEDNDATSLAAQTANPSALGLIAFGYTTALLQGANTTWAEAGNSTNSTTNITYCYALFFGGLVQLLAGMWEFRRNNMFAATAFSSYGGFWLGYGIYGVLASGGVIEQSGPRSIEMFLSLWGIFTFLYFIVSLGTNIALSMLFGFLSVTFFLLAGGTRNPVGGCNKTAGWFGVWVAAIAWYIAFAELINEVVFHGRGVVPLGTWPWVKRHAAKKKAAQNAV